jgi:DNA-directed RNA polymerase specialized sigma24 family protein|tara:strand:+ start:227 stop:391 length:165 start_codon:yes stop_codon:yes gene_type:complete
LLTVLEKEETMEEEYELIRQDIEALAYILWKNPEDLPDEIQEAIEEIMKKVRDI